MKLTQRVVDQAKFLEGAKSQNGNAADQIFLRDDICKGFGVRITRAGAKSFYIEKWVNRRRRRHTIGSTDQWDLEAARKYAREFSVDIDKGVDPIAEKKKRGGGATFGDLAKEYRERHMPRKKTADDDERVLTNHLSVWNSRQLTSITRADVSRLHGSVGKKHPYQANRIVELVRKMFNLAHVWGYFELDNPAVGIERFKEEKRERFIEPDELPKLMESVAQEPNPFVKAAILTLLLTGARKSEVLKMKWVDLDLTSGLWRKPDTKAGRPHLLPLPADVVKILSKLDRFEGNEFVFCGRKSGGRLIGLQKAWQRIRERASLDDVRLHDIRRTTGSWLAMAGVSLPMIGKILDHSQQRTTQIYARFALDPVRAVMEKNAKTMKKGGLKLVK